MQPEFRYQTGFVSLFSNYLCPFNNNFEFTDYLQELNRTGSFPDESDVVPMCFMKCYLEKIGVISDEGDINEERALQVMPDTTKVWYMDIG